jgi:hypothetical protein
MSIGDIGDDVLAHVLEFVQDSVRAWAAVSLVNKSFNRAKSKWYFELFATRQETLDFFRKDHAWRVRKLEVGTFSKRHLYVPNTKMHVAGFPSLMELKFIRAVPTSKLPPTIKKLWFWHCDIDDTFLEPLCTTTVHYLSICECPKVTGANFSSFRDLLSLQLHSVYWSEFISWPPNLRALDLYDFHASTLPLFPGLHTLKMYACHRVIGSSLMPQPTLRTADIQCCNDIKPCDVDRMLRKVPHYTH